MNWMQTIFYGILTSRSLRHCRIKEQSNAAACPRTASIKKQTPRPYIRNTTLEKSAVFSNPVKDFVQPSHSYIVFPLKNQKPKSMKKTF